MGRDWPILGTLLAHPSLARRTPKRLIDAATAEDSDAKDVSVRDRRRNGAAGGVQREQIVVHPRLTDRPHQFHHHSHRCRPADQSVATPGGHANGMIAPTSSSSVSNVAQTATWAASRRCRSSARTSRRHRWIGRFSLKDVPAGSAQLRFTGSEGGCDDGRERPRVRAGGDDRRHSIRLAGRRRVRLAEPERGDPDQRQHQRPHRIGSRLRVHDRRTPHSRRRLHAVLR